MIPVEPVFHWVHDTCKLQLVMARLLGNGAPSDPSNDKTLGYRRFCTTLFGNSCEEKAVEVGGGSRGAQFLAGTRR